MIITPMSLLEYYEFISKRAEKAGFKWLIMLIGRKADAEGIYERVAKAWGSLHNLTDERMAFVFSMSDKVDNNSFYHTSGKESYVGRMCPFGFVLGTDPFCDNDGDFMYVYDKYRAFDWKELHTQSISQFARANDIKERDIPGLFVYSLELKEKRYIPLRQSVDIYSLIQQIVDITIEIDKKLKDLESLLVDKDLFILEKKFRESVMADKKIDTGVVIDIMDGKADYKENKSLLGNRKIRDELKRVGQWKRQRGLPRYDYYSDEKVYDLVMQEVQELLNSLENKNLGYSKYESAVASFLNASI